MENMSNNTVVVTSSPIKTMKTYSPRTDTTTALSNNTFYTNQVFDIYNYYISQTPPFIGSVIGASGPISIDKCNTFLTLDIFNIISKHKTINDISVGGLSWEYWCSKFFPQHPNIGSAPNDAVIYNAWLSCIINVVNLTACKCKLYQNDKTLLAKELALITLLIVGKRRCTPRIVANTWGIINQSKLTQHCERLQHLNQVFVNVLYLWQHTNILTAECMLQLTPGLQSMMKAIQNKTGVTTTHQPAYEGDIFTNILLQNYKQQQDSPNSSLTFEDLATQWYKDFLVQGHTATDNTGFENGIFAAYGIDKIIE